MGLLVTKLRVRLRGTHNLLTLFGNMTMAVALLLTNDFSEHLHVTVVFMSVTLISPVMLIGLSFLYFKQCHPWARLLKSELAEEILTTNISGNRHLSRAMSKSEPILNKTYA